MFSGLHFVAKLDDPASGKVEAVRKILTQEARKMDIPVHNLADVKPGTLIVTLGGDGTALAGLRLAQERSCQVLGINLGKLGFLAPWTVPEVLDLLKGEHDPQPVIRHLARGTLPNGEKVLAANEFVLSRPLFGKMSRLAFSVNHREGGAFNADAIVLATATGSTGHALSVGGPLLDPGSGSCVILPVAPLTMASRATVVPWRLGISAFIEVPKGEEVRIAADGQTVWQGVPDGPLVFPLEKECASVMSLVPADWCFYRVAQEKLGWNLDPR